MRYKCIAGTLLFLTSVVAFMEIITSESFYPEYSTSQNTISDLGGTLPPDSIIIQPSTTIFDTTMVAFGILIITAAYCIHFALRKRAFTMLLSLFGIGVPSVGVFNGSYGDIHAIFALLTFLAGGLSAVVSYWVQRAPLSYFSIILGGIALLDLFLYYILGETSPFIVLGIGELERWIAYPNLLWVTGFGGYLMSACNSE